MTGTMEDVFENASENEKTLVSPGKPRVLDSRLDCQTFEPNLDAYVDALLRPDPYLHQIERLMRRSA